MTRVARSLTLPLAFASLALATAVHAQCPLAKLQEAASNDIDEFGFQIAQSGSWLAVAELGADEGGSVHLFEVSDLAEHGRWRELDEVFAGDAAPGQRFGESLAMWGDTLVAGTTLDSEQGVGTGAVYVFERDDGGTPGDPGDDTWVQTAKLLSAQALPGQHFGASLALVEDTLVVGAPHGTAAAVYVFQRDDLGTASKLDDLWLLTNQLDPDGLSASSRLGAGVALSADQGLLLAGDPLDTSAPVDATPGAGVVFVRQDTGVPGDPFDDTWTQTTKLLMPSGTETFSNIGESVALADGFAVVGAPNATLWDSAGRVDVFDRDDHGTSDPLDDTFTFVQELAGSFAYRGFGTHLALQGDRLAVSAPWYQFPLGAGTQVRVFERSADFGVRSYDLFDSPMIWFLVGLTRIDQPFKGGVIVPSPDLVVGPVPSDAFGSVTLTGTWPVGIPSGTDLWFQSWAVDGPAVPANLRGSQGMHAVTN